MWEQGQCRTDPVRVSRRFLFGWRQRSKECSVSAIKLLISDLHEVSTTLFLCLFLSVSAAEHLRSQGLIWGFWSNRQLTSVLPQPVSSNQFLPISADTFSWACSSDHAYLLALPPQSPGFIYSFNLSFFNHHCIQKGPDALVNCFEPNFGSLLLSQLIVMISNVRPKYLNYCIYFINAAL